MPATWQITNLETKRKLKRRYATTASAATAGHRMVLRGRLKKFKVTRTRR